MCENVFYAKLQEKDPLLKLEMCDLINYEIYFQLQLRWQNKKFSLIHYKDTIEV